MSKSERSVVRLLKTVLISLLVALFVAGCFRSKPPATGAPKNRVSYSESVHAWLVELPPTASDSQVISNLLREVVFRNGEPTRYKAVSLVVQGKTVVDESIPVEMITNFSIAEGDVALVFFGHHRAKPLYVTTNIGRKRVLLECKNEGWWCWIEDAPN